MSEKKIDNTFMRAMDQVNSLEKVFREGGLLEKAVMDIKGDVAWLKDIREALANAYESLEEGHIGTTGHMNIPDESIEENQYGGRLGFRDMEALGDKAASEIDMQARRMGSADMEPGDADELRYKIAVDMGYIEESVQQVTEGVLDADDDDGFMARSQLYFMARDAITLHGMIDDRDNLEGWVQSKIAQSAEAIDAVRRYTEYNAEKEAAGMGDEMDDMEEGYTILPPMDTEKYQARDGLEGPIPTKSGKVLYYDPKMGKYYDPDTDQYIEYDDWKQYDESMVEGIMEDCGCEQKSDITPIMRYIQLRAEGREDEAQQLAEAVPLLIPLGANLARMAAQKAIPFVIRQLAGKGAGNVAKKVGQRGFKKTGKILKRALRSKKNKAKAGGSVAGNVAMRGDYGPERGDINLDYLTKMMSSADMGEPALNEMDELEMAAIGRVLMDIGTRGDEKLDMNVLNILSRVGNELVAINEPFGPRNMKELSRKTMLAPDKLQKVIAYGRAKLKKHGEPKVADKDVEEAGFNFVKDIRKGLEEKYANDAQRKAVHAAKSKKNESGILYKAGVKKYGEKGMKAIQSAAGSGASAEEIGAIKDQHNKKKKG